MRQLRGGRAQYSGEALIMDQFAGKVPNCQPAIHALPDGEKIQTSGFGTCDGCGALIPVSPQAAICGPHQTKTSGTYRLMQYENPWPCPECWGILTGFLLDCGESALEKGFAEMAKVEIGEAV